MEIIEIIKLKLLIYKNSTIVFLDFVSLGFAIFTIATLIMGILSKEKKVWFFSGIICSLLFLFSNFILNISLDTKRNHIDKMCFLFDKNIQSDLKESFLENATFVTLKDLTKEYYPKIEQIQVHYYEENKTSDGFSDNKEFSKIYSLGYQNLLKIKKEMEKRNQYCSKNYCSDKYYRYGIDYFDDYFLQIYAELKCKEN